MFYSKIRACAIAADTQVAGCIVAAGGTDGIYKNLLPFVEYGILFASVGGIGARAPSSVMDFIEAFKNEELAFVLETLGYLCPHGFELLFDSGIHVLVLCCSYDVKPAMLVKTVFVDVAVSVMMDVDNGFQSGFFSIFHYFCHAVHPVRVDVIVWGLAYFSQPGNGDAD